MMHRSRFLQLLAVALATATRPGHLLAAPPVRQRIVAFLRHRLMDGAAGGLLERAFADIAGAGYNGVEITSELLWQDGAMPQLARLQRAFRLPVAGVLFEARLWDRERHDAVLQDVVLLSGRLRELGGTRFGISVDAAGRVKTDDELDLQCETLRELIRICTGRGLTPHLRVGLPELANDGHELLAITERLPHLLLGPDTGTLSLARLQAGDFFKQYSGRLAHLYLRDLGANGQRAAAIGDGTIDFAAISRALDVAGFSGMLSVDLGDGLLPQKEKAGQWKRSRAFARQRFGA